MKMSTIIAAAVAALMMGGAASAAENWRVIGTASYEMPFQKKVIDIGPESGRFDAIQLQVQGADVEIADFRVVYGNGESDEIQVRAVFTQGSKSRRIELRRGNRAIRQVIVNFRATGKARLSILGDIAEPKLTWVKLGCKAVDFGFDRDVIKVGLREGTFTKLRVQVADNPVEFYDLNVVYGNGQQDRLKIQQVVKAGQTVGPIDLSGKSRGIDRIEFLYRSIKAFKGRASVCASGAQLE